MGISCKTRIIKRKSTMFLNRMIFVASSMLEHRKMWTKQILTLTTLWFCRINFHGVYGIAVHVIWTNCITPNLSYVPRPLLSSIFTFLGVLSQMRDNALLKGYIMLVTEENENRKLKPPISKRLVMVIYKACMHWLWLPLWFQHALRYVFTEQIII